MKMLKLLSLFVALLAIDAATAQIPLNKNIFKLRSYGDDQLKVRVAGDYVSIAPGKSFRIAFLFDLGVNWYSYSDAKSSSHMPTEIELQLPAGFQVVKTLWSGACDAEQRYTDDFWVVYEIWLRRRCRSRLS